MIVDATSDPQFGTLTKEVRFVTALSEAECAAAGEVNPVHARRPPQLRRRHARVRRNTEVRCADRRLSLVSHKSWCNTFETAARTILP